MLIEIKVGKDSVWLRGGDNSYELCELRNIRPKPGAEPEPTLTPYKWYTNLSAAISSILDMKVRASDAHTLTELIDTIKIAKEELAGLYDI